jgi:hypothetical protein
MVPRTDQTKNYEYRTQTAVSEQCPTLFLQVNHIKAAYCISRVWNVYVHQEDVDAVPEELKKAYNTTSLRQFFPWKEYQSLQTSQQITILQLQNTFITEFRTLLIHGFHPSDKGENVMWDDDIDITQINDLSGNPTGRWEIHKDTDDVVMSYEAIEDKFSKSIHLKDTTISNYMQKVFLSGDKTPVFAHVYEPISGTREVLVPSHHIPEALDLIKIVKIDLCRTMNHRAIIKNFEDYDDLILSTTTNESWQPFDIQLSIKESPHCNMAISPTEPHHKRARATKSARTQQYKSYAAATSYLNHNQRICSTIHTLPTTSTTSTIASFSENTGHSSSIPSQPFTHQDTTTNNMMTLYHEIRETINKLSTTVETNRVNHQKEMLQLEENQNQKFNQACEAQQQQILEIGQTYIQQIQEEQKSNNTLLKRCSRPRKYPLKRK